MRHPQSVLSYLTRVGAEVLNFRRAMVKIYKGHYYIERALIKISGDGKVTCSMKEYAPTDEEATTMAADLIKLDFPKTIQARDASGLASKTKGELFEFIDRETGHLIMVQEKRVIKGNKVYIPWVMMDDGAWASFEPDGGLPFWKPAKRADEPRQVMIHEGAKAAAFADSLVQNATPHPWLESLAQYQHWGLIGGALAPHRTDYDELKKEAPTEVIYACDNDYPGTSALQKVSKCWGKSLKGLVYGNAFKPGWDIAEPMPKAMFARGGRYTGPRFKALLVPATWATDVVPPPDGKGRPASVIKPDFVEEWHHCVTPEVFIHRDWPNRILTLPEFNSQVGPFSNVEDTAKLLKKQFSSKASVLKYMPGENAGIYGGSDQGLYVNTFAKSDIEPEKGDPTPWLEFMDLLVPEPEDRLEAMRWVATLLARPGVKMTYGMLMISETQGVGKGTLGEKILAPLVGEMNVSYPSEEELVDSNFNYWLAHKRLAVVHEIYAGHSSRAYNKLKSIITDRMVTVSKKYQANYSLQNWIHIFACSNSMRAIKLSADDRRWFVPRVAETKRPAAYWEGLNRWLAEDGGLGIIAWWAKDWLKTNAPVQQGTDAPWSTVKKSIIEDSFSPGQTLVARKLEEIKMRTTEGDLPPDLFILDSDLVAMIRNTLYEGRHNEHLERPATVRAVAKGAGWHIGEARCQVKAWGPTAVGARVLSMDETVAMTPPADLGGEKVEAAARRRPYDLLGQVAF